MRLTVGPLPPAVYWRRRAVVLGVVLLFVVVLIYSCTGPGETDETGRGAGDPTPGSTLLTPESGAPATGVPESGAPTPEPSDPAAGDEAAPPVAPVGGSTGGGQQLPEPPPPVENECTDEEMSVIPVPSQTSAQRGEPIVLRLRIRNVSDRTCNRDVGADLQELYIKSGANKVWSSDSCSTIRNNNVKPFPPNHEEEYTVSWNGRKSSRCTNGVAAGPFPDPGTYQLFGRLGNKHSDPVRITITN
ncbi:hypothetical protein [Micromonospora sp. HM5-17]|jgi:hypothetical protein|uniref:hypothetical protein n=1 Tax=Micromonospora sp. HM5-17 TaxID=2487710 RepID=UPI000F489597|nr:hypothetical protein [Micromonospora sp. HM5-17]ROT28054.1 hypothetical protein EF879_22820 [Micromonospora sp. HM5-17]